MGPLDGQVALVTGGARGQGRSHAVTLAAAGADVVVCDIGGPIEQVPYALANPADLDETVRLVTEAGRRAVGVRADMRETSDVALVVDRAIEVFGRIDVLVANHGVISYALVETMTDDAWSAIVDTNLTGVFKVMRAVIPHMKAQGYGRIIATSSMAGRAGYANLPHYVASKWGVIGLVKAAATELAGSGITVNAVCPATVGTPFFLNDATYRLLRPDLESPTRQDIEDRMAARGRPWLQPEHVSRAVLYLATDADGVVSGQVTEVSMGASASMNA
jgi:SDR family mycofactocin-dependent oxidoreductase